jgi:hypothetical protein
LDGGDEKCGDDADDGDDDQEFDEGEGFAFHGWAPGFLGSSMVDPVLFLGEPVSLPS